MGLSRMRGHCLGVRRVTGAVGALAPVCALVFIAVPASAQDAIGPATAAAEVSADASDELEVITTTDLGPGDPCAGVTCLDPDPTDCLTFVCTDGGCAPVPVATSKVGLPGAVAPCRPLDPCATAGACAPDGSCTPTAFLACDDGIACTLDTCIAGQCSFTPTPACSGGCVPLGCDDGDPCTVDRCDPVVGCTHAGRVCDDQNPCTNDACIGGACVAFPNAATCDDGDACTRGDTCAAAVCVAGPAKVCDDGTACTEDACDPATGQCTYPRAAGACETCVEPAGPVERMTASFDLSVPLGVACPLVGGRAGVVLTAHGSFEGQREGCPICTASASGDLALSAEVSLCQGATFTATASGKFASTRKYGTVCDAASCRLRCADGYCESERFTGFAGLGVSRFLGFQRRWRAGGASWSGRSALAVGVRCGVAVRGEVRADVRAAGSADEGQGGACEDCARRVGALTVTSEGDGGCAIDVSAGRWETTIGCPDCAHLEVAAEGGASESDGACAGATMSGLPVPPALTVTSDATVTTSCMTVGLGWYAVSAACEATLRGSCAEPGCTTEAARAACTVLGGLCE